MNLVKAQLKHSDILLEWRNDKLSRKMSFSGEIIDRDIHGKWFGEKLTSRTSQIYIAYDNIHPIGQARFDWNNTDFANIHILVSPIHRGQGLGETLIRHAVQIFNQHYRIAIIKAQIKKSNTASYKSFIRAGFVSQEINHQASDDILQLEYFFTKSK